MFRRPEVGKVTWRNRNQFNSIIRDLFSENREILGGKRGKKQKRANSRGGGVLAKHKDGRGM